MAASAKANLPTKSLRARRVIRPVSSEVSTHPNVKSLKHLKLRFFPAGDCLRVQVLILKEVALRQNYADRPGFEQILIQVCFKRCRAMP